MNQIALGSNGIDVLSPDSTPLIKKKISSVERAEMQNTSTKCAAAVLAMLRGEIAKSEALSIIRSQTELQL